MAAAVKFERVSRIFGTVRAVDDVSLEIAEGEFFAMLGPSGSGKTTCLRLIAGFEQPDAGHIEIAGVTAEGVPPYRRNVNTVFQDYALFPHMSVGDNVAYGLMIRGVAREQRLEKARAALKMMKLDGYDTRKPSQLSGGQRQRVALARGLVMRPKVLLLDEPLSALDAKLRAQMQFELAELQDNVGITFVTVTHDQDEALSMACRIAVMNKGDVAQLAVPSDLYEYPANRFVADFIGSVNIFEGRLSIDEPEQAVVDCPELGRVYLNHGVTGAHETTVWVAIRPEKITMLPAGQAKAKDSPEGSNVAHGQIKGMSYLGDITLYDIRLDSGRSIRVSRPNLSRWDQEEFQWDDKVSLCWHPSSPVVLLS